jgi:hypothetical protein
MIHVLDLDPRQYSDPTYLDNHGSFSEVAIQINNSLKKIGYYAEPDDAEYVGICDGLNIGFKYKDKKSFVISVWETTSLPLFLAQQAKALNQTIFGLSNQITKLWNKYGFSNVKTVYGGTDSEFWCPDPNIEKLDKFTFLHINSSNVRSGLDLTIQSFALAFSGNNNVKLLIKDTNPQDKNSKLLSKINFYKTKYNVDIEYISERFNVKQIRDLYRKTHVTLNVLRATSFGMPLLDCSSCGNLCVTGDIEPTNELINSNNGILVPFDNFTKLSEIIPYLCNEWGLLNCYGNFQHIEEPYIANFNTESYAKILLNIYENWGILSKLDIINPIKTNWSWDNSATSLVTHLYGKI